MICASGTLGQIIPPSLVLILLAEILSESVGTMFADAMVPGLTLAAMYIWVRRWVWYLLCWVRLLVALRPLPRPPRWGL